jgi:hypothetical protein
VLGVVAATAAVSPVASLFAGLKGSECKQSRDAMRVVISPGCGCKCLGVYRNRWVFFEVVVYLGLDGIQVQLGGSSGSCERAI